MKHIILILLLATVVLKSDEYKLGSGVKISDLDIYIGGYLTAEYMQRHDGYNRLKVDDIALITYGNYKRLSYLSEFEIKDAYSKEWGKRESETSNSDIKIERLYADYAYSDNVEFRFGKFSTPVGYWNLAPVGALRDSASNPYLAYILYPKYSTGAQVSYEDHLNSGLIYTLMIQHNNDLDDRYNNIRVKTHSTFGVERVGDDVSLKANIGYFETVSDANFYYFLLSAQYDQPAYRLVAEYGARSKDVPYSLYLQGVYHLAPKHDLVGRVESYEIDDGAYRKESIGVIGYTYRPITPVTYKAEYQLRSYTNESQLKLSFSILF